MKKFIILTILFFTMVLIAHAGDFTMSGYLKNETSVGLDTFNDVSKFKNIIKLSGEYVINAEWALFVSTKYWYDAVYDWSEKYDIAKHYMAHVQRADWLRDCYLDYTSDILDMRLGRQQVVWGQADGISVLDRVNPVDLTEYWLQDLVDLRIPLWMINIKYAPKVNSILQLLVIPDFEQSTSAPPGAPFCFRSYQKFDAFIDYWETLAPGVSKVNTNIYYPGKKFKNSTFGLQWLDRVGELEYTLNFLYGYYTSARTYYEGQVGLVRDYSRRFKLWRIYGCSFNRTFTNPGILQGITLRGDFAYYNDEPTYYGNVTTSSTQGVNRWNNIFWLIGVDKYVAKNWLLSFQFAQYILQNDQSGVATWENMSAYSYGAQDQVENIISLKIATDFMHDRLKTEFFWTCTDDNQGRISPKVTFELQDNLWIKAGFHHFYGNEQDSNGQFRDKDQIYLHITRTF